MKAPSLFRMSRFTNYPLNFISVRAAAQRRSVLVRAQGHVHPGRACYRPQHRTPLLDKTLPHLRTTAFYLSFPLEFLSAYRVGCAQTLMDIIARNMNVTKWGSTPGETFFLQQRYLANIGTPPPLPQCHFSAG